MRGSAWRKAGTVMRMKNKESTGRKHPCFICHIVELLEDRSFESEKTQASSSRDIHDQQEADPVRGYAE
jgi:hypothetical protein